MVRPESGIDIKSTKQAKTPITSVNSFTNHKIEERGKRTKERGKRNYDDGYKLLVINSA
jgi:hypothetical protein